MSNPATQHKTAADRFRSRFIVAMRASGVKEPVVRGYVVRVEDYIKAFPERCLAFHTREDLESYLQVLGRTRIWQFRQSVDAI
ncbi:MAG: hypothetical protein ACRESZ_09555 [Methylococcales bacterium]